MIPQIVRELSRKERSIVGDRPLNEVFPDFPDVKDRLKFLCNYIYENMGITILMDFLAKHKELEFEESKEFIDYKGLVCELFLFYYIQSFIITFDLKDWTVKHSLLLELPKATKKGFTHTEVDVMLFTPNIAVVFECKCYRGTNVLTDKCFLTGSSTTKDIFKQNAMHIEMLLREYGSYKKVDQGSIKSVLFLYKPHKIQDKREHKNQRLIPVLDDTDIGEFLKFVKDLHDVKWDYQGIVNHLEKKGV